MKLSTPLLAAIIAVATQQAGAFVSRPAPFVTTHYRPSLPLFMVAEEIEDIALLAEEKMGKSVESVKSNMQTIRTGRANAAMLDRVAVDYYGAETPLNQMASISVPSSQQLQVDPYDKSILGDVEKAIMESDLGLTPNNDGNTIRINIPSLTEDRRKEMLKQCKAIGEEGKVAVRNIRRDGVDSIKKMEKNSDIGKDQSLDGQDEMQKMTDKFVKNIDEIVSKKETEVMKV
mmetsp:Transcript_24899/g.72937  ORF Transcript_24899/g.72937 Transcript_24899/m.72937 type:complete len:231 (-) Transcript_24899:308-1000(-)|eukprot:CAMPEP_0113546128 /NCGR_PEP_ID=MMETSP0015_2-20120614/11637_1 /TAXON_ID=2838 /ORGANISM="Odontella" /LENGTH=230 /DNA_ID=CAMNT_0000446555 /DNA_START=129 /DNA_END=821 /DNA_ORIENTATION=+ /assembly_acc=CAM_ASM_000160